MAKTQEELKQLKTEYETLSTKLKELTEDDFQQITGGKTIDIPFFEFVEPKFNDKYKLNNDVDLNNPWTPPTNNIDTNISGDFTGNSTNGSGGGVFNEGEF